MHCNHHPACTQTVSWTNAQPRLYLSLAPMLHPFYPNRTYRLVDALVHAELVHNMAQGATETPVD